MKPAAIKNANLRLRPPAGMEECGELLVHRSAGDMTMTSLWVPSLAELTALLSGHGILLTVHCSAHPPVMLEVTGEPL